MAYIANKPVRFGGRLYAIGAIVPDELIDPKMVPRLLGWGKIIKVDLPVAVPPAPTSETSDPISTESDETPTEGAGLTQDDNNNTGNTNAHDKEETSTEGHQSEGESNGESTTDKGEANAAPADGVTTETEPPFKCSVCGKVCATKTALTAHQKTHDK